MMTKSHIYKLFVDGASRNNPGPAGIGILIIRDEQVVGKFGYFIGNKTNNQAEYLALIVGLLLLKSQLGPHDKVHIISDSLLLVKQLTGEYRVKNTGLQRMYLVAKTLLSCMCSLVTHARRENNVVADKLANLGIDENVLLPQPLVTILHEYAIPV